MKKKLCDFAHDIKIGDLKNMINHLALGKDRELSSGRGVKKYLIKGSKSLPTVSNQKEFMKYRNSQELEVEVA